LRASVDIPRAVEKIVLRCLAKAPADRYADAAAVGAALDAAGETGEPWTRDDAARWWHAARVGRVPAVGAGGAEHTTDVGVVRDTADPVPSARGRRSTARGPR
jgi:hypothetical protein